MKATVFAPGSIGNVGPGFDVLGLAVEGIGDRVTIELSDGPARVEAVTGIDAELVPRDAEKNVAAIAATAWLRDHRIDKRPVVVIDKGLPFAGGLGGSAASSVGGAYATAVAAGFTAPDLNAVMRAALEAEATVAGRHLDNIAPCALGGLTLVRSVEPIDVVPIRTPPWCVVLLTPHIRIETRAARQILPRDWPRESWVQQMANTAALAHGFATGDGDLVRRALDDRYAEPVRASMIPDFHAVKRAALEAGALGCSISGSGPTIFAITFEPDGRCAAAMKAAIRVEADVRVVAIAHQGVRVV